MLTSNEKQKNPQKIDEDHLKLPIDDGLRRQCVVLRCWCLACQQDHMDPATLASSKSSLFPSTAELDPGLHATAMQEDSARLSYCLRLAGSLFSQGLVDPEQLLEWAGKQLADAGSAHARGGGLDLAISRGKAAAGLSLTVAGGKEAAVAGAPPYEGSVFADGAVVHRVQSALALLACVIQVSSGSNHNASCDASHTCFPMQE